MTTEMAPVHLSIWLPGRLPKPYTYSKCDVRDKDSFLTTTGSNTHSLMHIITHVPDFSQR